MVIELTYVLIKAKLIFFSDEFKVYSPYWSDISRKNKCLEYWSQEYSNW